MTEYNLVAQMEKYDSNLVEEDLKNLEAELADESKVSDHLILDASDRIPIIKKFIEENKETVARQHSQMKDNVKALRAAVTTNIALESADDEYKALITNEDAQNLAKMLAELRTMSRQYKELLMETGRQGRPLF